MTDSILLFSVAVLCFGLGLFVIFELLEAAAQSRAMDEATRKWWAERAAYRAQNPPELSDSSLIDDYNSALPEPRQAREDSGPKAA